MIFPGKAIDESPSVTTRTLLVFWLPMLATWLMMSVEGPFLAAVIARLADPKFNLAAYGVAFSLALMVEAPIIMMMSASTALVSDRTSYLRLRNFTLMLNGGITLLMIILIIPPVFSFLARDLIGLPEEVARLTHITTALLLPWPGAIGFRRFYQGLLIRYNLTRRVAYGTVIRLVSMTTAAVLAATLTDLPGAAVGGLALSTGVTIEALASRFMVHATVRRLLHGAEDPSAAMSYRSIFSFYYPLAMTSILALGVHPMITFFLGQSRMPLESLAALPVINSLVFIFRSFGLGIAAVAGLAIISMTPLADFWFLDLSGLSPQLAAFAILPTQILVLIPGTSVLLSFQRSVLVATKRTAPVTMATLLEVGFIIVTLAVAIVIFDVVGAVAAAIALVVGRLVANAWLTPPMLRAVREARGGKLP
jgi:hypothetical protein